MRKKKRNTTKRKNPAAVRKGTKKSIPAKWTTAKVRRVGGKVQVLI